MYSGLLTPEDKTGIDGISPNAFDVFPALASSIKMAGFPLLVPRLFPSL